MKTLKIPYWIGGWYKNKQIYLQPISTLLKKRSLNKILFSEYFHFFLDETTANQLPGFLNEYLSYYFYHCYFKISFVLYQNKTQNSFSYKEFLNPSYFFLQKKKINNLFNFSLSFFYYCEKKYRKDFWQQFITALAEEADYEEIFYNLSGDTLKKAYERFLLE